jgi:hypothetical protein
MFSVSGLMSACSGLLRKGLASEMPTLDRLQKTTTTTEEIGRLRKAYELALREIGVKDRDDPLTEGVAKGIVEAGQARPTDQPEELSRLVERLRL